MMLIKKLFLIASVVAGAVSFASADMIVTIRDVEDGVSFGVSGSIDTSVFPLPVERVTFPQDNFFYANGLSSTRNDSVARTQITLLRSSSIAGERYKFEDALGFSYLGFFPRSRIGGLNLSATPTFPIGYTHYTLQVGDFEDFQDHIVLPEGYVSGSQLEASFVEPNVNLDTLLLVPGEFWGIRFTDGNGGEQSLLFQVVPEPSAFALLASSLILFGIIRLR